MNKEKTARWRYFTGDGKRKKDLKIVKFTGEKAAALINETAFLVTYENKGSYELRLEQDI